MLIRSSSLYQKFIANIKWNALSATYYQTILTLFMIWLFQITPLSTYGLIGTIFACLYLLVDLLDLGFDGSLAIDFKLLSASKQSFRKIFLKQQLGQLSLLSLASLVIILAHKIINSWFATKFSCCSLTPIVWLILALLLISEGLLKDLRALAQLFFLSEILALVQVLGITIYAGSIFAGYYFFQAPISLELVFAPLLLSSILSLIILSYAIYKIYKSLDHNIINLESHTPETEPLRNPLATKQSPVTELNFKVLAIQRFWVFVNQISKLAFNGNFLITLLASLFGATAIAPLKLISRIAVFLRYVLYHSFGLPIRTLLSQTQAKLTFQNYRTILASSFYVLAGILTGASLILITLTVIHTESLQILMRENSLIFLGILLLDNLFLAHEQYLLVANQIYFFAIPNLITIGLIYGLANSYHPALNSLLLSLAALRIFTFILINFLIFKKL